MATLTDRINAYLDACPAAISGQHGHDRTFAVAIALVRGFDLSQRAALPFLRRYNQRCQPKWTTEETQTQTQGCRPGQVQSGQTPQAARLSTLGSSCPFKPTFYDHRLFPGFAGIMRASMLAQENRLQGREIKVVVASPSKVSEGAVIKFAKKVTKHMRVSRGWSFVSASVQSMGIRELPALGTPQQTKGNLTAWIIH